MSNQNDTDDLLQSLQDRSNSNDAPVEEDNSPAEDIDAFLAGLEDSASDSPPTPAASKPSEPDPFADAFGELESLHGDAVEQELAMKYAAAEPIKEEPPVKVTEVEAAPLAKTPEQDAPPVKEEKAEKKADKKAKKKKPEGKIKVVETERSKGFLFTMGLLKWSTIMMPVLLASWLVGAFVGEYLATGWAILLIALLPLLLVPLILKMVLKRGRWWYFALPLSLLTLGALVGLSPGGAGTAMSYYGHWPVSTVSQLAGMEPDNAFVRSNAYVSEFVGTQVRGLDATAPQNKDLLARALGTDTELVTWADTQRKEAAAKSAEEKAAPAATEETKKEEAPAADEAKAKENTPETGK